MDERITSTIIILLSLAMTIPLTQPSARATGPPYTWNGPTDVRSQLGQDNLPTAVQAANGTLWLAWQTFRFSNTRPDIIYQTLTNGTWSTFGRITSTGFNTSPALAQLANGTIMLFWSQDQTIAFNIYYERFSVNSFTGIGTWSSSVHLTTPTKFNDTAPAATVGADGTLWLFWQRSNQSCTTTCIQTKQIYYKTLINGSWSTTETQVTNDKNWNSSPSVLASKDRQVRLAWSRGGQVNGTTLTSPIIYYKTYDGTTWSAGIQVVSTPSGFGDQHPSMIQDRNGTVWLFWARTSLTTPQFILFNKFSTDNAQTWSGETQMLNEASGVDDQTPWAVQGNSKNDKTIHLFYSSDRTNFDYDIWTLTSPPITPIHDLGITFVSPQPNILYSGGMPSVGQNSNASVALTVVNHGDTGENVQATVQVSNTTTISLGTQTQPVNVGGSVSFFYSWNTTKPDGSVAKAGRYNILVSVVSTNSTETPGNQGDNSLTIKNSIHLLPWGDVDQDGADTLQDVSIFVFDFGATPVTTRWNPFCDITNNGAIDLLDVSIAVKNFGITS